ncbi:type VI secretion system Vgr family protein [Pseudomonas nunensis]|uniref:Type VI secretion system tip protein VgrG n=1 Tax=Pseudomonas nunensis TaxID=2961896 RepID=A0ABY5EQ39_9PSED|nr:type VI secretion system Vgr family protein [Pseudomonas nunensis]KPN90927.1 type IV secretion protein Rhs [Pseudomonas nunensis]MCL5228287.1 type VI secretion system tip protein VgrG [Pseudomonas nunensis]UTO17839.1 type VI secretion system tip protein VgrG [Pseudomonas nunensis]
MLNGLQTFFDHSRHTLGVRNVDARLDVLAFEGEERLSKPFIYRVEFTCTERDLPADNLLGQDASFSLHAAPQKMPLVGLKTPEVKPLRTLHGVVTGFKRLSGSNDEACYEITLQPRLALLDRGQQFRIYQHQSVPQIVESILRSRHGFEGQDFLFRLVREYPKREQVMQYGESDLTFIARLLAEVGIWYRFTSDERLYIDVVEFCDDQRQYQFNVELPYRPLSGLSSSGEDSVWQLQSNHRVVEQQVHFRAYQHRDASAHLSGAIDQSRGATTTYGEAYHYAEPYRVLGDAQDQDEDLQSESGYFFARLRHERYLNDQTQLSGVSSSAILTPGQVLKISGGAPKAFTPGAVITGLTTRAARDRSFEANLQAMPYSETVCFRPIVPPTPQIAGTVPARVTSSQTNDPYAHIDLEGRYRVKFLFDRDRWKPGEESLWLRLARPYAGDTHGLHLPLIPGTEVAIAFEQGDPDRPYIAHALHDSQHPDHVTLRNDKRNVLRTPANNKLRMDDTRGQEHVKLSTEHSGKSQLNLGHLVDAERKKRGEGFELRTDGWGAIRGAKGVFISADAQAKSLGDVLAMAPVTHQIECAKQQIADWQNIAPAHRSRQPAIHGLQQFQDNAKDLSAAAILLSAPKGIGAVTPASLLLKSGEALYVQSDDEINLAAAQRLSIHASQAISLLAQQEGMRLVSGKGPVDIESHGDAMNLIAQHDITVQSVQGHLQLTAKNGITLGCGGAYIRLTPQGEIQIHGPGLISIKGQHRLNPGTSEEFPLPELPGSVCKECLKKAQTAAQGFVPRGAQA